MNDLEKLSLIYENIVTQKLQEDIDLNTVSKEDLSNFIFAHSNGGTENFTIWTIRKNTSKTDPFKKAGDEMMVNGKLKIPEKAITGAGSPLGNAKERYDNYDILTMYVSSIDGESYIQKFPNPKDRIRNVDISKVFRLKIGGETYNIS
jgi:hypothetical protein